MKCVTRVQSCQLRTRGTPWATSNGARLLHMPIFRPVIHRFGTHIPVASYRSLLLKAEIRDVVVLHHVAFRLDAHLVGMLRLRFAAGGDEVVVANDLYPDESLLDISVDRAARFLRGRTLTN